MDTQGLTNDRLTPQIATGCPTSLSRRKWRGHLSSARKLATQCTCASNNDERKACAAWWTQQTVIHRALKLPPTFWPCLPDPNGPVSTGVRALYAELEKALTGM
jgi:hypothetical protein